MNAPKVVLSFLILSIFYSNSISANYCDQALDDLKSKIDDLFSKKQISYDDLKLFADAYEDYQVVVSGQSCEKEGQPKLKEVSNLIKEKRLKTLETYKRAQVYEEAGTDLKLEYGILTGQITNKKYAFSDLFLNKSIPNTPPKYVPEIKPKPEPVIILKEPIVENKIESKSEFKKIKKTGAPCSEILNQNETVNLENVRNQDGVGWCYAYTASDLLSYRLNKKISAVSLYNSDQDIELDIDKDKKPKGGVVGDAITKYINSHKGLCLESELPSTDFSFCTNNDYISFLRDLYTSAKNSNFPSLISGNLCLKQNLTSAFPKLSLDQITEIVRMNGTSQLVEKIYEANCKNLVGKDFTSKPVYVSDKNNWISTINNQLEKEDIVGISYTYDKVSNEKKGDHASIVIGRKFNEQTNKCEYLVRNSWGKTCDQKESSDVRCHKNCDSFGNNCRYSGHFWVTESKLQEALLGVTYLP
jgi:hypothetical protein